MVDLDAGRAVKRSGHRHTRFPGTDEPLELLTQFFIPVPDTPNLLAVVAFASPTVVLEASGVTTLPFRPADRAHKRKNRSAASLLARLGGTLDLGFVLS